ncbi:MAG: hypothetical protein K0U48_03265, partial [Actinomycetia bacterium]|nr:hypothetical protein [Actinomycetes bacterium]
MAAVADGGGVVGGTGAEGVVAWDLLRCSTEVSGADEAVGFWEAVAGLCEVTTGSVTGCNPDACGTPACN